MIASGIYANISVCAALLRPTSTEGQMRERARRHINKPTPSNSNSRDSGCEFRDRISRMCSGISHSLGLTLFYTNIRFLAFFLCGGLTGLSFSPIMIYLIPLAVDGGVSKRDATYIMSIVGVFSVFGRLSAGKLMDRRIMTASRLSGVAYAVTGIIAMFLPIHNSFIFIAVLASGFGLSSGVFNCLNLLVGKEFAGVDNAALTFAWRNAMSAVGGYAGVYVSGNLCRDDTSER